MGEQGSSLDGGMMSPQGWPFEFEGSVHAGACISWLPTSVYSLQYDLGIGQAREKRIYYMLPN